MLAGIGEWAGVASESGPDPEVLHRFDSGDGEYDSAIVVGSRSKEGIPSIGRTAR